MNEDRCVCCGEYVPEGQMVCRSCLNQSISYDQIRWRFCKERRQADSWSYEKGNVDPCGKMRPKGMLRGLIMFVGRLFRGEKYHT